MFPIDVRDVRPIYEQIIDHIKEQVIKGVLKLNGECQYSYQSLSRIRKAADY